VDHQLTVRVGHRVADLDKQAQPLPDVQRPVSAVLIERRPLDMLHDQGGAPVRGHRRVQEPRDAGMLKHAERPPFNPEPAEHEV
jgi:hypothetical protein